MHINTSAVTFFAAALIAVIVGGLMGWYFFVRQQIESTESADAARGFGQRADFASQIGSTIGNIADNIGISFGNDAQIRSATSTTATEGSRAPKLWQVSRTPVAGLGFAASTTRLYYVERASGNIVQADPLTSAIVRVTNTLYPKVHEALIAHDGSVVLRWIDESGDVHTFAGRIATSTDAEAGDTPKKLTGVNLPKNIISIAARSSPYELFFTVPDPQGGVIGFTTNWNGGQQKRIFGSKITGWNLFSLPDGTKYVSQKASEGALGYAFKVGANESLELVQSSDGISILPKSGSTAVLYSTNSRGTISLYGRTHSATTTLQVPVRTIVEKCVWSPEPAPIAYCAIPADISGRLSLRDYYDGTTHTRDTWWRIDVAKNTAEQIFIPSSNLVIDVESPRIDASGRYIAFMNAIDKSLWLLAIQ